MLNLMYITNNTSLAEIAILSGVDRIFVDLEALGKFERQGHLSTVISGHTIDDVVAMRKAFPYVELLVRINPVHVNSAQEIEDVLRSSPQLIMLPMYKSVQEVQIVADIIKGRAGLVPLAETPEALQNIDEVCSISGVNEMYLGMNDLHIALGGKFMFEFLGDGTVDKFANIVKSHGKKFGFGGIARIGEGLLPAERIIAEHERLGSNAVILSRTFHRENECIGEGKAEINFLQEVKKIRLWEKKSSLRSAEEKENNFLTTKILIENICEKIQYDKKVA